MFKTIIIIMNIQMFFSACLLFYSVASAQIIQKSDSLFNDQDILKIKLSYSNAEMRMDTDDTTFIKVNLEYYNKNKFYNKFNLKMNYIVLAIFIIILTIVMALLYF